METIYLSLRAQVAEGTFFMKSPVCIMYEYMEKTWQTEPEKYLSAFVCVVVCFPHGLNYYVYRALFL